MPVFDEVPLTQVDLERGDDGWRIVPAEIVPQPDVWEQDYRAMVQSLRDYMGKTGFKKAVLGLSGGVDSALVATIAVDAIGADNVRCVMLPSEYTSQASLDDAEAVAKALGVHYDYVPISESRAAVTDTLAPLFAGRDEGPDRGEHPVPPARAVADGDLEQVWRNAVDHRQQIRGRGGLCHDLWRHEWRLQPDQGSVQNPRVRDLPLAQRQSPDWMMGPDGEVIRPSVIDKPPSAELREDQKDSDSLPDYPVLDAILDILVDQDGSIADCVAAGFDEADARKVEHLIYISEYKRFQSAPGTRLSKRAFWLDRRYPIVNRWRDRR